MIISKKRQYQDTASIREPGRCLPEFCDDPVDQTSRDPKLVARRNHKFLSHFRLIGQGGESPYALDQLHVAPGPNFLVNRCRRVQSSVRGACLPAPPDFISIKEEAPEQPSVISGACS